ncbi:chemerin-like receptor 1 [Bombina bombina]|uniref:chemerin-like receptor 1 n=1 Tax=Bombina bombina TaxID=8345 RepID=UPI00235A82DA|nr:chemerin-like receptor 1 [Bombina bombina]
MEGKMLSENLCYFFWDLKNISEPENVPASNSSPLAITYTSFVVAMICCIIGLISNVIVIYITGFVMKEKRSNIWFLHLAVADFLFLLFLPFNALSEFNGSWQYGSHLCKMYHFLSSCNIYASIFIITALNIDRVLSVAKPIWHRKFLSPKVYFWTCTSIWIITVLGSLPAAFFSDEYEIGGETQCLLGYVGHNTQHKGLSEHTEWIDIQQNHTLFNKSAEDPTIYYGDLQGLSFSYYNGSNDTQAVGYSPVPNFLNTVKYYFFTTFEEHIFYALPLYRQQCKSNECCATEDKLTKWNQMLFTTERLTIPLIIIGYFFPLFVILFSNLTITIKVRHSQTVNPSRLYRIVVTVVLVYFLTWTPLVIAEIIFLVAARNMDFSLLFNISMILPLLTSIAYSNCCLNPIMYVLVGKNVKSVLRDSMYSISQSFSKHSFSLSK